MKLPIKSPPRFVKFLKKNKPLLKLAKDLLELRASAHRGDLFDKSLAVVSAVSLLADAAYPGSGRSWGGSQTPGHHYLDLGIGGFLCDLLYHSDVEKQVISMSEEGTVGESATVSVNWPTLELSATYDGPRFSYGPFGRTGGEERMKKAVQDIVWGKGVDYMLATSPENQNSWFSRGSGRFRLEEMPAPGAYIGEKTPAQYAARLSKHGSAEPRSILLIGPSGAGKSVLGRLIAKELAPGTSTRTLKIASNVLKTCRYDEILGLVQALKPTVLLLDDCNLADAKYTEEFLAILEALHQPGCIIIVTMMTEKAPEDLKRGALCFPGMRPGRIDETFVLGYPSLEDRVRILTHYLGIGPDTEGLIPKVAGATEGVTGAYLREISRRLILHGYGSWEEEVTNVLRTAPVLSSPSTPSGDTKSASAGYSSFADALCPAP